MNVILKTQCIKLGFLENMSIINKTQCMIVGFWYIKQCKSNLNVIQTIYYTEHILHINFSNIGFL